MAINILELFVNMFTNIRTYVYVGSTAILKLLRVFQLINRFRNNK